MFSTKEKRQIFDYVIANRPATRIKWSSYDFEGAVIRIRRGKKSSKEHAGAIVEE